LIIDLPYTACYSAVNVHFIKKGNVMKAITIVMLLFFAQAIYGMQKESPREKEARERALKNSAKIAHTPEINPEEDKEINDLMESQKREDQRLAAFLKMQERKQAAQSRFCDIL
jgi:sensor histidine kinase regulating citrate/malate metabolism